MIPVDDDPQHVPVAGQWYITVVCKGCGERVILLHDPNVVIANMTAKLEIGQDGKGNVYVQCPACRATHPYNRQELESVQAE